MKSLILGSLIVFLFGGFAPTAFARSSQRSLADLSSRFENNQFKIIVVPGHDLRYWGTQFLDYKEAEVTLALGEQLVNYLTRDGHFDVSITRKKDGSYSDWLLEYIEDHGQEILAFARGKKDVAMEAFLNGSLKEVDGVEHNKAPGDAGTYLYAINKYANDVNADLVLHIHFNDYPRSKRNSPGVYSGFSIYVPESQLGNASATRAVADALRVALGRILPGSDYGKESAVLVEDQELIAIGVDNQRSGPSLLVEYGYIYEPMISDKTVRPLMLKELAYQTYRGIVGLFESSSARATLSGTTLLPYHFAREIKKGTTLGRDALALQYALKTEGFYPPPGYTFSNCPLSGVFGSCTEEALKNFQEKNFGERAGVLGKKTRALLNQKYGE